jgi:membrane-bound lytic murein transglycosylase A
MLLVSLILSSCASAPPQALEKNTEIRIHPFFVKSDFSNLPGWGSANHSEFLKAFADQCSVNGNALARRKSTPTELIESCRKARQNLAGNSQSPAKNWLESHFEVWQLQQENGQKTGLLTGYFEPLLKGSRSAQFPYTIPLYGIPEDLITVKLDEIYPELKGKRLRGRLQGNDLVPFFDRATWTQLGAKRETPIAWVTDKLDAFLLEVQGSGRLILQDGSIIRLSYAEQNGHPYQSIGKVLVDRGELTAERATIPGIKSWAKTNPNKLDDLLNSNPSLVFFKENKVLRPEEGPIGAMGVPLTEKLSLAIDREKIPYGSPIWIESIHPLTNTPIEQGTLAQDTGGAIRGRIRADYFWGTGEEAGQIAGLTRQPLKMWLIWPKNSPLPKGGN